MAWRHAPLRCLLSDTWFRPLIKPITIKVAAGTTSARRHTLHEPTGQCPTGVTALSKGRLQKPPFGQPNPARDKSAARPMSLVVIILRLAKECPLPDCWYPHFRAVCVGKSFTTYISWLEKGCFADDGGLEIQAPLALSKMFPDFGTVPSSA